MNIRVTNDDTGDVIEKKFSTAEEMRMWIADNFERSPMAEGVYYQFADTGMIERFRLEVVK